MSSSIACSPSVPLLCNEREKRNEEESAYPPRFRGGVRGCVRDPDLGSVRAHAHAAGKLSIGFWDHWVPGANDASRGARRWSGPTKEKVDVQIDYITSQGDKLRLTIAAESQARSGHDIMQMATWWPHAYANGLEPVDDIVADADQAERRGRTTRSTYLGRAENRWIAVPATTGSQIKGPCSRIDLMKQHAGIDVQAMYPAGSPPKAENWTLDTFLKAAEACHKAGFPFGIGLGTTSDSVDTAGAIFRSFGAVLVDANEKITVKTDAVRQALDYYKRCAQFFPPDAPSWDDASNNKWLVSGKGALIMNPPSAWAVAKRDAPQGRRAVVDARHAGRAQGTLRAVHALLLGDLELQQEQVGRQEPPRAPVAAVGDREDGRGQRRLRRAVLREPDDAQDLGRGRAAEGYALSLPQPATTTRSCRSRRRLRRPRSRSRYMRRAS